MPTSPAAVLEQVLRLANAPAPDLTDAELLGRFLAGGEEAAFTLLVQRHGPLVLGVCRRMLGGGPDAEDAFQATFLVLLRNAASVRKRQSLASWLYGVACRVALRARGKVARRRVSERQAVPAGTHPESADELTRAELRAVLDEEVGLLPEKHRLPVLLCYLEGKSHEQAARELGWPKSSVTARLERAREGLRRRLARRGFAAPAGLVAVVLAEQAAVAVPASLILSAARPASRVWAAEAPPDAAASLAEGVTGGTAAGKGPALLALVVSLGLAAVGVGLLPRPPEGGRESPRPEAEAGPLPAGVLARLGSPRLRHGGFVRQMLFSPDGKTLAGLAPDGLYLWDPATGRLRHRVPGDPRKAVFSADGRQLLCIDALKDPTLRRIDAAGKEVGRVKLPAAVDVEPAAIAPDGGRIALGSEKHDVFVFDADGREVARIPGAGRKAVGLAFSPDGKTLAVADKGDTVRLHDAASGKRVGVLRRERAKIATVAFAPDGRRLAALCSDSSGKPVPGIQLSGDVVFAQVWDLPAGKERRPLEATTDSQVCTFSPDGRLLVVASFNADLVVHDLVAGKCRRLHHGAFASAVAFSPDGKTLAVDHFGNVALRDAATLRPSPASADPLAGVGTLQFAPDGKRLFGTAGDLLAWDPATGREVMRVRRPEPQPSGPFDSERAGTGPVIAVAPDGSRWAAADTFSHGELEAVHMHDLKTGKKERRLVGPPRTKATAVRFSADGRRMAAVDPSRQTNWVWDVDSGRVLWSRKDEELVGTRPLALSPDGRRLAFAALTREDATNVLVDVLELDTGRPVRRLTIPGNNVVDLAFTPDGARLAVVVQTLNVGEEVRLWDVAGGAARERFRADGVEKVTFAPDGRMLAGTGPQSPIRLWELNTGKERARFRGHRGPVACLAWSPDSRTLAAASNDAPVYVWDVRGLRPGARPSATVLARAWEALAGDDAEAAFAAVRLFAGAPDEALPFLRRHVRPVAPADPQRLRRLLADLDAERFATREAATAELAKLAEVAEADLRRAAADGSPEVRRRLEPILSGLDTVGSESRRAVRAVEALEWMASAEAVRLLDELAGGAPGARLTREAAAARDRLARRDQ